MPAPFEIIAAPFTAYAAVTGTAFPAVTAEPAVAWVKIGTSGDENYDPEGVTVRHAQDLNLVRPLGTTAPVKAFRRGEDLVIAFTVWDLTAEAYKHALNGNAIATVAAGVGTPGTKTLQFYRGGDVEVVALLLRANVSPYADAMAMQYQVPRCVMSGTPEVQHRKGEPAGLAFEFTALKDQSAATDAESFGRLVMQHQVPLPPP